MISYLTLSPTSETTGLLPPPSRIVVLQGGEIDSAEAARMTKVRTRTGYSVGVCCMLARASTDHSFPPWPFFCIALLLFFISSFLSAVCSLTTPFLFLLATAYGLRVSSADCCLSLVCPHPFSFSHSHPFPSPCNALLLPSSCPAYIPRHYKQQPLSWNALMLLPWKKQPWSLATLPFAARLTAPHLLSCARCRACGTCVSTDGGKADKEGTHRRALEGT